MRDGNQFDLEHVSGPPSSLGTAGGGPNIGRFAVLYRAGSPVVATKKKPCTK